MTGFTCLLLSKEEYLKNEQAATRVKNQLSVYNKANFATKEESGKLFLIDVDYLKTCAEIALDTLTTMQKEINDHATQNEVLNLTVEKYKEKYGNLDRETLAEIFKAGTKQIETCNDNNSLKQQIIKRLGETKKKLQK